MGIFAVYMFSAGVYLLAGYLIYKWLFAGDNQPTFNRAMLLSVYAASFVLPLFRLDLSHGASAADHIAVGTPQAVLAAATQGGAVDIAATVLLWVYLAGIVVMAGITIIADIRLARLIAGGERRVFDGYTLVTVNRPGMTPFSWSHFIIVADGEDKELMEMIIRHESAHIRLGHFADLLVARVVCILQWFNPAAWLMLSELKAVHEFQADRAVLDAGVNITQYQQLLIKKTVGLRFQSFANSLNHSNLKKRITMMYRSKSSPVRRMRALAAVPAAALAMALLGVPAVSQAMTEVSSATLTQETSGKVNQLSAQMQESEATEMPAASEKPVDKPDVLPEYPGGMNALMKFLCENIKYPADAIKAKIQGKVIVGFTVGADGKLSDFHIIESVNPSLDAEALRVVKELKETWTPGKQNGTPIACSYALPLTFRLD